MEKTIFTVNLGTINEVKGFVQIMCNCPAPAEIHSGRYIVDAKSIMGIFSLDLSKPVELIVDADSDDIKETIEQLKPFVIAKD